MERDTVHRVSQRLFSTWCSQGSSTLVVLILARKIGWKVRSTKKNWKVQTFNIPLFLHFFRPLFHKSLQQALKYKHLKFLVKNLNKLKKTDAERKKWVYYVIYYFVAYYCHYLYNRLPSITQKLRKNALSVFFSSKKFFNLYFKYFL